MATILTTNQAKQHFPAGSTPLTGANTINFQRPVNILFITTSGAMSISFDGGLHFMDLTQNVMSSFYDMNLLRIDLAGAGTCNGVGISI